MGRVTGMRRLALTAALFAGALVFLLVAIVTHRAAPLFVMWVPLLTVPVVLGRADPTLGQPGAAEPPEANPSGESSETTETNQA